MVPSASAWSVNYSSRENNFRSGELYSTWSEMAALTTPGKEMFISPRDSFDFVPSKGYGQFEKALEAQAIPDEIETSGILTGFESAAEWARAELKNSNLIKSQVPIPNESLAGKVLTIKSAQEILPPRASVMCHEIEQETYFCHKTNHVAVQAVEVSPSDKLSTLHVACHYSGETSECHVMNVGDIVFFAPASDGLATTIERQMQKKKSSLRKGD